MLWFKKKQKQLSHTFVPDGPDPNLWKKEFTFVNATSYPNLYIVNTGGEKKVCPASDDGIAPRYSISYLDGGVYGIYDTDTSSLLVPQDYSKILGICTPFLATTLEGVEGKIHTNQRRSNEY